jgi:hypothetical protein
MVVRYGLRTILLGRKEQHFPLAYPTNNLTVNTILIEF